jgi:hypothetical protein
MPAAVELDDADRAALIALLKQMIAADPFPLSARSRTIASRSPLRYRGVSVSCSSSSAISS